MAQTNLKQLVDKVLKEDDRLWNEDKTELNQTLLLDLVEKIDEKVIELLLDEKDLREKFFVKIKDVFVFKTNEFRFFMEENKIDNSYTDYKNRIGLSDGKKFLKDTNDVVLDFPYKDCVLEGGQSTEEGMDTYFEFDETVTKAQEKQGLKAGTYNQKTAKRKEIFFNQVLAYDEIDRLFDAKALTNWKRFTKDGEQKVQEIKRDKDGTIKENLIIKGNNLLALHSLKKQFTGKVKLIYIDPPYNTGNDGFKYNDNFNHSTWLTFMKNRLEIAKELLRDDGVIFVQCDDNEQAYLKVLMDEVFGRENFVANIVYKRRESQANLSKNISPIHDIIISFSKTKNARFYKISANINIDDYKNNDNDHRGKYVTMPCTNKGGAIYEIKTPTGKIIKDEWRFKEETYKKLEIENRLVFPNNGNGKPRYKLFLSEKIKKGALANTWWDDVSSNQEANKEIEKLFEKDKFITPKSEGLLKRIIELGTKENDIVLDFFGGSGTTGAVAHKMNRQYILTEQMDYIHDLPEARLKKVIAGEQGGISKSIQWQGGGDFIYFELAKWNETAKEKIQVLKSLAELESFFAEMSEKYFLNYNLKIKEFQDKVIKEGKFKNLTLDEQKKIFIAMLDNNQIYVNKTEMADKKFGISKNDQELTFEFYNSEK